MLHAWDTLYLKKVDDKGCKDKMTSELEFVASVHLSGLNRLIPENLFFGTKKLIGLRPFGVF